MPRILVLVAFFLLCVSSAVSQAPAQAQQPFSSLTLREDCKYSVTDPALSSDEHAQATICLYYIAGVIDGYQIGVEPAKRFICLPKNVSYGQLTLIVSKFLEDHPAMLQNDPEYLIVDAISEAFPCKTAPKPK